MARTRIIGVAVGILAGVVAMDFAVFCAGGGHGTYVPATALFPFSMLSTALTGGVISPAAIGLAFLQFPIYGFVMASATPGNRKRAIVILAALHVAAAVIAFVVLRGGAFA
jgi:hypothetical protein